MRARKISLISDAYLRKQFEKSLKMWYAKENIYIQIGLIKTK